MGKYQVANIKFEFNYHYDKYFQNNIENYEIPSSTKINHAINVLLKDELTLPIGQVHGNKNPYVILNSDERIIYFKNKNKGSVSVLIRHDYDYQNIVIELNKNNISDLANIEYIMSGIMFLELAMHLGYLPIHGTAIAIDGEAVIFSAPSGTGKSTHARYWKMAFPDAIFINDDKPLVNVEDGKLYVYGSPFSGEHHINKNIKSKLKAIVFLRQGLDNKIEKVSINEILPELIKNTLNPKLDSSWNKVIPLIEKIYNEIPCVRLYATNSIDSAYKIHEYLFGKNND